MKDYSQNGEQGLILGAIERIMPRTYVEFGAGDGYALSNTRALIEQGWMGYQIDREKGKNDSVIHKNVTAENINEMFWNIELAIGGIGVASIDVDGNDYWLWKALDVTKPCIVVIEFNPTLSGSKTIKYDPDHRWTGTDNYCGASFDAMLKLGHNKGYKAIAKTVCNLIFVRADRWSDEPPVLTHEPVAVWPESGKEWVEV